MLAAKTILGISIFWAIMSTITLYFCAKKNDYSEGAAFWAVIWYFSITALIASTIYVWAG